MSFKALKLTQPLLVFKLSLPLVCSSLQMFRQELTEFKKSAKQMCQAH